MIKIIGIYMKYSIFDITYEYRENNKILKIHIFDERAIKVKMYLKVKFKGGRSGTSKNYLVGHTV